MNDTFLVNTEESKDFLMNLSDPNVTFQVLYGGPYNFKHKRYFVIIKSDEIKLEEAINGTMLQIISLKNIYVRLFFFIGWAL